MKLLLDEMHASKIAAHRFPRSAGNHAIVLAGSVAVFLDEHGPMLAGAESFTWWLERADPGE